MDKRTYYTPNVSVEKLDLGDVLTASAQEDTNSLVKDSYDWLEGAV